MDHAVGVDLGGTKVLAALVSRDGSVVAEERRPTPAGGEDLVDTIVDMASAVAGAGGPPVLGVGAAGMVTLDGAIRFGPNVEAFRSGLPMRATLEERLAIPVVVDNDANAAAWGEYVFGAARGATAALVVTLGTGIGGGVVEDGRLLRGAHGYANEIGHFQVKENGPRCACGEDGHWEAVASGRALGRLARERLGVDGEALSAAATAGDEEALAVLGEYAEWVAVGLAGLVNVFDPGVVVVGGGLVSLGDSLLDAVRRAFRGRTEAAEVREAASIVPAQLGELAGAVGAAALAAGWSDR